MNEIIKAPTGLEATEQARLNLWRQAVGYETEDQDVIVSNDGSQKIIKRKRHVPGDPRAMALYLQLFGE